MGPGSDTPLLGVPARSYVRTLVQYNAMSVLFLVTRPIMSGVSIFNQMRGRFTLLLYYVALSLCAPDVKYSFNFGFFRW